MSWEGIIIEPSEIAMQTEEMTGALEQDNEALRIALGRLSGFQTEEELSSLAWNSLKGRAAYVCLILQGLICANEVMIEDNRQLNSLTDSILGNEAFYGESIAAVLAFQQELMETYQRRMNNLQRTSRQMIGVRLSTALVDRAMMRAEYIVSSAQQVIAQCMEQRERVEQFLSATAHLYEYADMLYSHVAEGIATLEQNGAAVDPAASTMQWVQPLGDAWNNRKLKQLHHGNTPVSEADGKSMAHLTAGVFRLIEEFQTTEKNSDKETNSVYAQDDFETDNFYYLRNREIVSQITGNDPKFDLEIEHFQELYQKYKYRYESLSMKTGVPAELIASIHYRECPADFDWQNGLIHFSVYLHNGQKLGEETTVAPRTVFFEENQFDESVIDALEGKAWNQITDLEREGFKSNNLQAYNVTKLKEGNQSIVAMITFAEYYNGANKEIVSTYLYSGAQNSEGNNIIQSGKFVSDGVYDSSAIDQQPGIYLLLNSLMEE